MQINPAELSASALVPLLARGTLTVADVARSCLERVSQRDATVRAWSFVSPELVMAQAAELDRQGPCGPLFGIPIGVKDVMLTHDMPTQYNSPLYRDFHPLLDAAAVATLRAAGALVFGKTDTVEFAATGQRALTRNPRDPAHTPGGSSSGSAAAVADCHVPLALGTQTGGSIIRPASYCGVYGFKPTWNLVSREGAKMFSATLDTVGWFGRSAADLALMLEVFDPHTACPRHAPLPLRGARIAVCPSPVWGAADADTRAALQATEVVLRGAGCVVTQLQLPPLFDRLPALHAVIMNMEAGSAFLSEFRQHPGQLHASFLAQVENASRYSRTQLCEAYDIAAVCRAGFDRIAAEFDAVVTPSTVGCAPFGLEDTGPLTFNAIWSLLHVPVVNVPGLLGAAGLPIGISITGPRFADRKVLAAAAAIGAQLAPPPSA